MDEKIENEQSAVLEVDASENTDAENAPDTENISSEETPSNEDDEIDDFTIEEKEEKKEEKKEEEPEQPEDETAEEVPEKKKIPLKPILISVGATLLAALLAYGGGAWYYSSRFFFNTTISGSDCSNLTVEEASQKIRSDISGYKFVLKEIDGAEETINGADISLEYTAVDGIEELKNKQNPFKWFIIEEETRNMTAERKVAMNEEALKNTVNSLKCVANSDQSMNGMIEKIRYSNGAYHIDSQGIKNVVSRSMLYDKIKAGISELYPEMSLEEESCYVGVENEDRMKPALEQMNKYVSAKVTYKRGSENIILDGDTISNWVSIGSDYKVTLSEGMINEYVSNLADKFNTCGKSRSFTTSGGSKITVSGGDYGWRVNVGAEEKKLTENINNGEQVEREPEFRQRGADYGPNNDLPNTYVEVSIDGQHVWAYKNGNLIVSTDCVTGDPTKNRSTDTGVYYIKYKERNATLKGEDYSTPVSYWMPFNGGQGLHDLNRGAYGGSIYKGNGSHGCVNLPYDAAQTIYENFPSGTPVVVY